MMSPSIRGSPVQVFAENHFFIYIFNIYDIFLFFIWSYNIRRSLVQVFARNHYHHVYILSMTPNPQKKRNHTHERAWICGWMNRNYEEVDINAWDGSFETSKRRRLHRSLYLWDCICSNSVSNFLVTVLCSHAKLETDILINCNDICTDHLSPGRQPLFEIVSIYVSIYRFWEFMSVYIDFELLCRKYI